MERGAPHEGQNSSPAGICAPQTEQRTGSLVGVGAEAGEVTGVAAAVALAEAPAPPTGAVPSATGRFAPQLGQNSVPACTTDLQTGHVTVAPPV
jgi:hypothetical protein